MPDRLEMSLKKDIAEVTSVIDAVEAFGEHHDLPAKAVFQLNLVLDELITNIVSYGFDEGADSVIRLEIALADGWLDVELADNGKAFNPVEAPLRDVGTGLEDRKIGGLGLKFVRTFMDRLDYRRDGGFNRLRMHMDLNAADRQPAGDTAKR